MRVDGGTKANERRNGGGEEFVRRKLLLLWRIAYFRLSFYPRHNDGSVGPLFLLLLRLLVLFGLYNVANCKKIESVRPEIVLLDILAKPFAPTEWSSSECRRDSVTYLEELARYVPWALTMYDASAKMPAGLITGNYQQLGNYDECLKIRSDHGFVGQACNAIVQFEITKDDGNSRSPDLGDLFVNVATASKVTGWREGNTVAYEWMWCVPSTCNHTEVQEALEIALDSLKVDGRVDLVVNVTEKSCRTLEKDRVVLDTSDWIYISIIVIFALIVISSTIYDITTQGQLSTLKRKGKMHIAFSTFSVYTNCKNLLNTERHRDSIACLDAIRYLSICWIIYGHTYYTEVISVKVDLTRVPRMHEDWSKMLVLNGNIVTDTFFLLSGTLLAYTEMIKKEKSTNWNLDVLGLYVHRYLRLTPAYAMMIGFYATLFNKMGSGPHWGSVVGSNRNYCRENWWTNLLYVNNYVNVPNMCMSQSWYLAVDMQLIWLSPIFLYPMIKFTRNIFFWLIVAIALSLSILTPFVITFLNNLTGTMLYYKDQKNMADVYLYIYIKVYTRAGPYIIGLSLGYLLYKTRSFTVKMHWVYVVGAWLLTTVAGSLVIFGPRGMYYEDHVYSRIEASLYAAFHRHVFALSVSWMIFASVHGYAGLLGQFLSWRGWIPLSKLSYSAYLCHFLFLLSRSGSARTADSFTEMSIMYVFLGNLGLTMALSMVWTLTFEIPFMILDRTFLSTNKKDFCFAPKTESTKIFGSLDSSKEIYRSTEESTSTISQIYKDASCAVVSRAADNNYYVINEESAEKRSLSSAGDDLSKEPSYVCVPDNQRRDVSSHEQSVFDYSISRCANSIKVQPRFALNEECDRDAAISFDPSSRSVITANS